MKNFKNRFLQTVLLSLIAVCGSANAADNIVEVADKAGTFKTLLAAAKAAGLAHTLQEDGPFTVFAPTDDAFAKLPKQTLSDLLKPENQEKLATILKYHVISGNVAAADAVKVESATTLSGDTVRISIRNGRLTVNDANVISNDVKASNGVIHVIDAVLLPLEPKNIVETAAAAGNFKTLLAAVEAAGLAETLKGDAFFTVLAPTDEAFAKLPHGTLDSLLLPQNKHKLQALLKYHVLPDRLTSQDLATWGSAVALDGNLIKIQREKPLSFNRSKVVKPVINASNGIIYVIDQVLTPPIVKSPFLSEFTLLQRLDPALASKLKSRKFKLGDGTVTTATFCNLSSKRIQVYWIYYDGTRKKWRDPIPPGALETCKRTFAEHVWLIADEHGKGLGLYVLGAQDGLIVHK